MAQPEWGYRRADNEQGYEARLFPNGRPPRGWADTPAKLTAPKKPDADRS